MLSETKLNVLKQISGDFSRDEAIWASGYLAGLAGGTLTATLPPQQQDIPVQNTVKKITLAYGTETGNSKIPEKKYMFSTDWNKKPRKFFTGLKGEPRCMYAELKNQ